MGTMSRYQHRIFGIWNKALVRSNQANRDLQGQRLADVLTVIRHPSQFNRACRRMVYSYFRKHCRRHRVGYGAMLTKFRGMSIPQDTPAMVQMRLLSHS